MFNRLNILTNGLMISGLIIAGTVLGTENAALAQKLQHGYPLAVIPQNQPSPPSPEDTTSQQLPRPVPRPGMSEYQPADYADSMTATRSDAVTSQKGQGMPGTTPQQIPRKPYNGPSVTVPGTGIRAYFNAPVPPPYNASANYNTYGGQPGGGRNSILEQSAAGQP